MTGIGPEGGLLQWCIQMYSCQEKTSKLCLKYMHFSVFTLFNSETFLKVSMYYFSSVEACIVMENCGQLCTYRKTKYK